MIPHANDTPILGDFMYFQVPSTRPAEPYILFAAAACTVGCAILKLAGSRVLGLSSSSCRFLDRWIPYRPRSMWFSSVFRSSNSQPHAAWCGQRNGPSCWSGDAMWSSSAQCELRPLSGKRAWAKIAFVLLAIERVPSIPPPSPIARRESLEELDGEEAVGLDGQQGGSDLLARKGT